MARPERNTVAVEQLRQLHAATEGEFKCRAALQLALVLADLVAELPADDEQARELAQEGLRRLDEGAACADAVAPPAAVERARSMLSARLPPPDVRAPTQELLDRVGPLDPTKIRGMIEAMRVILPSMEPGDPKRMVVETLLPLMDSGVVDAIRSGRWDPAYDGSLAALDRLTADITAAGGTMDPQVVVIFGQMAQRLHAIREASGPNVPPLPDPPAERPVGPVAPDEPRWATSSEIQQFRRAAPALKILVSALSPDDPVRVPMLAVVTASELTDAVIARNWTEEHDRSLAELRALVDDSRTDPEGVVFARAAIAVVRGARCEMASESADPADRPDAAELTDLVADLEDTLSMLPIAGPWAEMMAGVLHGSVANLLLRLAGQADGAAARQFRARAAAHVGEMPPEFASNATQVADIINVGRLGPDGVLPDTEPGSFGDRDGSFDAGFRDLTWLMTTVDRAKRGGGVAELTAAVDDLRTVRRGMPAGHPQHTNVQVMTADMLGRLAVATRSPEMLVDAVEAAITAVRTATPTDLLSAAAILAHLLGQLVSRDARVGPFEPAEAALVAAADRADPDDARLRLVITLGLAGARVLRSRTAADDDADLQRRARETLLAAEDLVGEPTPDPNSAGPAWLIFAWAVGHTLLCVDAAAAPIVVRLADKLERLLTAHPDLAEQMSGQFGGQVPAPFGRDGQGVLQTLRTMKYMVTTLTGDTPLGMMMRANPGMFRAAQRTAMQPTAPPVPAEWTRERATRGLAGARTAQDTEALRAACEDLRAALQGGLDDDSLRQQVNAALGVCLTELCRLGDDNLPTLTDAVRHLESALASGEHHLPTTERADLMDCVARCHREFADRGLRQDGGHHAERAVRAALRELARCVLVADGTAQALTIAARANEIVARAVTWCLTDGRPGAAAEIAEAGRSLVLASVVLSGRVESVLRGAGEPAAADAWRRDDATGKLASLNKLWQTKFGDSILSTPTAREISAMLVMTPSTDGLVYLVPPAADGSPAHAVVLRASLTDNNVELLELPPMHIGAGTPLGDYRAALAAAIDGHDPDQRTPDGFRGTPDGQRWARALDDLGAWTHKHVIGPLVAHTRNWATDRTPHLTLVPLGDLAAIPYAAAWTADPDQPGGRRYAVHDLVLSHSVSARLLGEVLRRPHQPVTERVVLVPDPTGQFPYARAVARALTANLYKEAEIYGRQASNGPATVDHILAALPGTARQGASLLHLSSHASTRPTPRLRTQDGWLELSRILEQARGRPVDAAGGLIITNACLTDSTHHYDEAVTLTTALLAAGATGVIGTRWPIDDDTTATFTYHLHHRLALGDAPTEALRQAQLSMLDPRPRPGLHPHLAALPYDRVAHPASWAAFTYHGT